MDWDILKKFSNEKNNFIKRKANLDALQRIVAKEKEEEKSTGELSASLHNSILVVQDFANSMQSDIIGKFENLITKGVKEIFDKDYRIKIEHKRHGNIIHADFYVYLPNKKKVNLYEGEGGGLRDFISVLQRILYLILEPNKVSKMLFLDENLKHLDSDRAVLAFKFICKLLKQLDVQTIFITHSSAAKSLTEEKDVSIIEIENDGTKSYIKR